MKFDLNKIYEIGLSNNRAKKSELFKRSGPSSYFTIGN